MKQELKWTSGGGCILIAVVLALMAALLVAQIEMATTAAAKVEPFAKRELVRQANFALGVLALDIIVMFWLTIRLFMSKTTTAMEIPHKSGPHVDAWATAGARIEVDTPIDIYDEDNDEDEDDSDGDYQTFDEDPL